MSTANLSAGSAPRCDAMHNPRGWGAFIAASFDEPVSVRCRLLVGHEGDHKGAFQPFPGFADEIVTWPVSVLGADTPRDAK